MPRMRTSSPNTDPRPETRQHHLIRVFRLNDTPPALDTPINALRPDKKKRKGLIPLRDHLA